MLALPALKRNRLAYALFLAGIGSLPLHAQPQPPPTADVPAQAETATSPALAKEEAPLAVITVVGDWLGTADKDDVRNHPGARDVLRREDFERVGAVTVRDVLNRIPGVNAPENNGTGSHEMAMNFGIRGLNPRLASRSTLLLDGIPLPFAPYGQPQMSFGGLTLGNIEALDVVRGGGAVRYGPQNVGGIVNFVTRAIPESFAVQGAVQWEHSPRAEQEGQRAHANLLLGGTLDNGFGAALLYSGMRGGDYRDHSDTRIDDLILKGRMDFNAHHSLNALLQYYEGRADMPGGLDQAQYAANPIQSVREKDSFWGRRKVIGLNYLYQRDDRELALNAFYTRTLRSGYLDQGSFLSLSPRNYWVRGLEGRFAQGFVSGQVRHELGIGYRHVNEASSEQRYREPINANVFPHRGSRKDRDTRGQTRAHAFYVDDRIEIADWTLTPGIRYEIIDQEQLNVLTKTPYTGKYHALLPALNVRYRLSDAWSLYANTEGSFGSVQYSQMPNRVAVDAIKPEKARTWELGSRYDNGPLQAEANLFLIHFDNQYDSSQTNDSVIARGKTRHQGLETALVYRLGALNPALEGVDLRFNYVYSDASIRQSGSNYGNQVPFSSRHKGLFGIGYSRAGLRLDLESLYQSGQYADNENTEAENAAGNMGRIPGYAVWNARVAYDFGPNMNDLKIGFGIRNLFDRDYFTRSFDDNNRGKYLGTPRTYYLQASFGF
ncbi:TonB-dependent siderophore receptor [Lysobacteraceae bacterium NML120232]|nr:TonB-dependent siderophore receptor [Xanthomonadaceae bacterium NML120232]